MDYSLSYFLDLVFAFLLGAWVADKVIFYNIRKALEEAGVDFEAEEETASVSVKKFFIETINDRLYLYEFGTNNFICHGNTLDELALYIKNKSDIAGVKYNEDVIWFVDGEVRKTI